MTRKSFISERIEEETKNGYTVYTQGSGTISQSSRSKLGKALNECEASNLNATDIIYVVGAKKQLPASGFDWAVMFK